jgi:hypothetical protein
MPCCNIAVAVQDVKLKNSVDDEMILGQILSLVHVQAPVLVQVTGTSPFQQIDKTPKTNRFQQIDKVL